MENKKNQAGVELANALFNAFFGLNNSDKSVVTDLAEIKEVLSKKELQKVEPKKVVKEFVEKESESSDKEFAEFSKMMQDMNIPYSVSSRACQKQANPSVVPVTPGVTDNKNMTVREKFYAKQRKKYQEEKEASDKTYEKYLYELVVELMECDEVTPLTKDPTEDGSGIGIYILERPQLGNLLNVCRELKANQDWRKIEYLYADEGVYLKFYF